MSLQFSLPHSIAQLSSCLKKQGHEVKLFDTTMYKSDTKTDEQKRIERGQIKSYIPKGLKTTDKYEDFNRCIEEFNPDNLMITFVDNTIDIGMKLLESAKRRIYTIAGGVSVILTPSRFSNNLIDVAWDRTATEYFFPSNPDIELMDDWTIFDSDRLYRPMSGKYYKTIPILTDYGCPYSCGFCCAPRLRDKLKYKRKSLESVNKELQFQIDLHNPEFIYFSSETFFSMPIKEFKEFSDLYKKYQLPFWCQSHINTITEERVKLLQEMNCHKIAVGVECGNEKYRKEMIGKNFTKEDIFRSIKLFKKYNLNAAANFIIGFPLETPDITQDTINLAKEVYNIMPDIQINCYVFQPYYGTRLRDYCEEHKLLKNQLDTVLGNPVIKNPYISDETLMFIRDNFNKLISE